MSDSTNPTTVLSEEQSLEKLGEAKVGRLVVLVDGEMDLFPVNYVMHDGRIVFRTAEGTKLFSLTLNQKVLFEADSYDAKHAWSVVAKGTARRLESNEDIQAADKLPLKPWIPTLKYNYVEITPSELSGRGFEFGEEPERYQA